MAVVVKSREKMWSNMRENGNWETYSNQAREREKVGTVGSAEKIAVRLDDEGNLREKNRKVKKKVFERQVHQCNFSESLPVFSSIPIIVGDPTWWQAVLTQSNLKIGIN